MTTIEQDVGLPSPAPESNADAVCVAVQIRPLVDAELAQGCQPCLTVTPGQPQVSFCEIRSLPATFLYNLYRPSVSLRWIIEPKTFRKQDGRECQRLALAYGHYSTVTHKQKCTVHVPCTSVQRLHTGCKFFRNRR